MKALLASALFLLLAAGSSGCASLLALEVRTHPAPTAEQCMQACIDDRDACYLSGRDVFECRNDLWVCLPGCQGVFMLPVNS
jgi:hypothetical protein